MVKKSYCKVPGTIHMGHDIKLLSLINKMTTNTVKALQRSHL
jgi:hypothetical protein